MFKLRLFNSKSYTNSVTIDHFLPQTNAQTDKLRHSKPKNYSITVKTRPFQQPPEKIFYFLKFFI